MYVQGQGRMELTWCPLGKGIAPGSCWARRSTAGGRLLTLERASSLALPATGGRPALGAGEGGRDDNAGGPASETLSCRAPKPQLRRTPTAKAVWSIQAR